MSQICEFCNKTFTTRNILQNHQKTAKYCVKIQNREIPCEFNCNYCKKEFMRYDGLQEHLLVCKEKIKNENDSMINELINYKKLYEKQELKIKKLTKEYDARLEKQKEEYETRLEEQKKDYEIRIKKYEERYDKQQEIINRIALKPTAKTIVNNHTNNTNHTNNNFINFNDTELLNKVIKNNVDQAIVKKGQIGLANVVYHKYLKADDGTVKYKCVDASRQNFEFVDEKGEVHTDIGEKCLTDAISKRELTKHVSGIAKDIPNLYDKDEGHLDSVIQLTDFEKDNSKFRKEMVRLTKSDI